MIEELFAKLGHAVEGSAAIALGASFVWGILSIVLSPCHLSSIPLVVAVVGGQGQVSGKRAFLISTLFASGILITIAVIGAVTAYLGRMLGDVGPFANYIVAAVLILFGFVLLDVVPIPFNAVVPEGRNKGLVAALLLGLVFGIAIGPCTFAYMAPMLAVSFKAASARPVYAVLLLVAYGVGHCSVIVTAGTSTRLVQKYAAYSAESKTPIIGKRLCAVFIIIGALYIIYVT
jgi:cytochrome c-type biogenesis protein